MLPIFLVYSCYFTISMAYYFPIHHQIWLTETSVTSNSLYFKLPEWSTVIHLLNIQLFALTSVAQLTGRHPASQRSPVWFGWGHMPRLWVHPWLGHVWEETDWCFSLTLMFPSLSFSPQPLSLKINTLKKLKKNPKTQNIQLFLAEKGAKIQAWREGLGKKAQ